jgi:hypothetical protein
MYGHRDLSAGAHSHIITQMNSTTTGLHRREEEGMGREKEGKEGKEDGLREHGERKEEMGKKKARKK